MIAAAARSQLSANERDTPFPPKEVEAAIS